MSQNSILHLSGMDYNMVGGGYRCVLISGNSLEIEGIKSVAFFSAEGVDFNISRGVLRISGENLRLISLSKGYACLSGRIDSVTAHRPDSLNKADTASAGADAASKVAYSADGVLDKTKGAAL